MRGGSRSNPTRQAVAERRRKALEFRRAGLTLSQIVERHPELGYKSKANLSQDLNRALDEVIGEPARDVIALELSRLDGLMEPMWVKARKGDVNAVYAVLKVMERRARFQGLDADKRSQDAAGSEEQRGMLGALADGLQAAYDAMEKTSSDDE